MRIFFIAMIVFSVRNSRAQQLDSAHKRIIFLGHTYVNVHDAQLTQVFIQELNALRPSQVCVLGDARLWEPSVMQAYKEDLNCPVAFLPGNHELSAEHVHSYDSLIGTRNFSLTALGCRFIGVDHTTNEKELSEFLVSSLDSIVPGEQVFLLSHNRLWDDHLLEHDNIRKGKTITASRLLDLIRGKVDYIVAGSGPGQYFGRQHQMFEESDTNVAYWCDMLENIPCYSIGMGLKSTVFIADVYEKSLSFYPVSINAIPSVTKEILRNKEAKVENDSLFYSKRFLIGLFSGALLMFLVQFVLRRRKG